MGGWGKISALAVHTTEGKAVGKKRLPADESAAVRPPPVPRGRRGLKKPVRMHVERGLVPRAVRVPVFMYVCSLRCASFGVSLGACVHPPRRTRELKHASGINKCPSCALVSRVTRCKGKQLACALLMLHLEMETPPRRPPFPSDGLMWYACTAYHSQTLLRALASSAPELS